MLTPNSPVLPQGATSTSLEIGTDIAFMGGMINYVLENNLFFKEYVANYTNAAFHRR